MRAYQDGLWKKRRKKNKIAQRAGSIEAAKEQQGMPQDIEALQDELRIAGLKINWLKAMIDISDEQHGTDIRKKAGTRQSRK